MRINEKAALGRQNFRRQRSGWESAAVCRTRKLTAGQTQALLIEHVSSATRTLEGFLVSFRLVRYKGPIIVLGPQCFGRRSAHLRIASSAGQRDWPHSVNRYSTFGGTWRHALRWPMPSASMLFHTCPTIFSPLLSIALPQ